jgi:hypothetical protein
VQIRQIKLHQLFSDEMLPFLLGYWQKLTLNLKWSFIESAPGRRRRSREHLLQQVVVVVGVHGAGLAAAAGVDFTNQFRP